MCLLGLKVSIVELKKKLRVGDKIERIISAVGITPCSGCRKRKAWLNGELDNALQK